MKKVLSVLFLAGFLTFLALPALVSGQNIAPPAELIGSCTTRYDLSGWNAVGLRCPVAATLCNFTSVTQDCAACCIVDTVYSVSYWIFAGLMAIVVIFVLLGAYNIITAGGSPEKVTTGRNYILWAAIGGTLALLARVIPTIVRAFLRIT